MAHQNRYFEIRVEENIHDGMCSSMFSPFLNCSSSSSQQVDKSPTECHILSAVSCASSRFARLNNREKEIVQSAHLFAFSPSATSAHTWTSWASLCMRPFHVNQTLSRSYREQQWRSLIYLKLKGFKVTAFIFMHFPLFWIFNTIYCYIFFKMQLCIVFLKIYLNVVFPHES